MNKTLAFIATIFTIVIVYLVVVFFLKFLGEENTHSPVALEKLIPSAQFIQIHTKVGEKDHFYSILDVTNGIEYRYKLVGQRKLNLPLVPVPMKNATDSPPDGVPSGISVEFKAK